MALGTATPALRAVTEADLVCGDHAVVAWCAEVVVTEVAGGAVEACLSEEDVFEAVGALCVDYKRFRLVS